MAQVNPTSLTNWQDGDVIDAADWKQEREILYTAINDNYARLIKQYKVVTAAGATKTTQNLTTALNTINFKESDRIALTLDTATSTLTIGIVPGGIQTADLKDSSVTAQKIADGAVTTTKLQDLSVTLAKIANGVIDTTKINTTSFDARYYTEVEMDAKLALKSDVGHNHDSRYYTATQTDTLLGGKSNIGHNHDDRYYQKSETYTKAEVDANIADLTGGIAGATSDATPDTLIKRDGLAQAHVGTPSASTHIAQKATVDAVQTNLNTHAALTNSVHGATSAATPNALVQRDTAGRFKAAAPLATDDVARKAEVDAAANASLPKSGGTMTGDLTVNKSWARLQAQAVAGTGAEFIGIVDGVRKGMAVQMYGNDVRFARYSDGTNVETQIKLLPAGKASVNDNEIITSAGGQTINGNLTLGGYLVMPNNTAVMLKESGGTNRFGLYMSGGNRVVVGDIQNQLSLRSNVTPKLTTDGSTEHDIWHNGNQGNPSTLSTTSKQIVGAINELFQSASNGKTAVATAITGKGVPASGSDTFAQLASKIGQIQTPVSLQANYLDIPSNSTTTPTIVKTFEIGVAGSLRLKSSVRNNGSNGYTYGTFRKNGVEINPAARGQHFALSQPNYVEFTVDVTVDAGDHIELVGWCQFAGNSCMFGTTTVVTLPNVGGTIT